MIISTDDRSPLAGDCFSSPSISPQPAAEEEQKVTLEPASIESILCTTAAPRVLYCTVLYCTVLYCTIEDGVMLTLLTQCLEVNGEMMTRLQFAVNRVTGPLSDVPCPDTN